MPIVFSIVDVTLSGLLVFCLGFVWTPTPIVDFLLRVRIEAQAHRRLPLRVRIHVTMLIVLSIINFPLRVRIDAHAIVDFLLRVRIAARFGPIRKYAAASLCRQLVSAGAPRFAGLVVLSCERSGGCGCAAGG